MKRIDVEGLSFDERGLIPAIVQDEMTNEVLMLAYMNQEALKRTIEQGETWFYSRSREELWHKGATSGNTQSVRSIAYDCDGDALLIQVNPKGPACHTGKESCFYRSITDTNRTQARGSESSVEIISKLYDVIQERQKDPVADSYTCYLFDQGLDKILKKVGEETAEVIIGAKNQSQEEVVYEMADLIYHLLVLMVVLGVQPEHIRRELSIRTK